MSSPEWRGLRVGDVYEIACFPGHRETVESIEVYPGGGEWMGSIGIEWATVWGIHHDLYQTRSETKLHVGVDGRPAWRRYAWTDDGHWRYTEYPLVILTARPLVQLSLFEVAA